GLFAARVLSDHFERVTLIERDELPAAPENHRGVPQGRHTHGLLASGGRTVCRFFPGMDEELLAAGAVRGDSLGTSRWFFEGGMLAQGPSGMDGYLLSRPTLEHLVRRRVLAIANVTARQGCRAEGPVLNDARDTVIGVRAGDELLAADLVIDATGRGT